MKLLYLVDLGAEIVSTICEDEEAFSLLEKPIIRICGKDLPIPFSPELEKFVVPNESDIFNKAKKLLNL